jgi:DNA-binding GntR family transcriptional regulator
VHKVVKEERGMDPKRHLELVTSLTVCCTVCGMPYQVHKEGRLVTDERGQPEWQRVRDDLRRRISEEEFAVGERIPSTAALEEAYGVSSTSVRRAVQELRVKGVVYGVVGKGVFVKCKPPDHEDPVSTLAAGLAEVRDQLAGLSDDAPVEDLRRELSELRTAVATLQAQLIDLYGRVGQPYPHEAAPLTVERQRRAERGA